MFKREAMHVLLDYPTFCSNLSGGKNRYWIFQHQQFFGQVRQNLAKIDRNNFLKRIYMGSGQSENSIRERQYIYRCIVWHLLCWNHSI